MTNTTELVNRAMRRLQTATRERDAALAELHDAIAAAHEAGTRQVALTELTGYTREHIRRITRARRRG